MRRALGALLTASILAALAAPPASSAKVVEWWRIRKTVPPVEVPSPTVTTVEPQAEAEEPSASETPTQDAAAARLAEILEQAAARSGLALTGETATLSAEDLAPPPTEVETTEEVPEPVELPGLLASESVRDYEVVALAAVDLAHPKGQTIRAALVQLANAGDAWGLFSRNRGDLPLSGLGQAANFGRGLRLWKGRHTVILAGDPADAALDKIRLSKLARDIAGLLPGGGAAPQMVAWLPGGNQLAHTVTYFHAEGPIGSDSLGLSAATEGVAAEYQVGENVFGGLTVRYPDEEAALAGWRAFVEARMGGDADSGTPGSRRTAPEAERWNGTRAKGRVCAFVVGAATRNQAETFLSQALGQAHD